MKYTGYLLSESSRRKLEVLYPPKLPNFIGHHITEQYGVGDDILAPEQPHVVKAIGYARDDLAEGFLIELDGTTKRPTGGLYHLTWSIDRSKGGKPVHTNEIIGKAEPIHPITLEVTPKIFT